MAENTAATEHPAYRTMESALYCLAENQHSPPSLGELADMAGLSEFHFQKMFTRWVGISPKRFSQYLTKEYIKSLLDQGVKPLDACYQSGLSGPGRMHDLFINTEAMSPAQYQALGKGLQVNYGIHQSPFGPYLLAVTAKGICHLAFMTQDQDDLLEALYSQWSLATLEEDDAVTFPTHEKLFNHGDIANASLSLLLKGTNFQIQVWQALLRIPLGQVATYEGLARLADNPAAIRASASAIARNNIAWLVPCHRVIRKIGDTGNYRWGSDRKKIILGYEAAIADHA